MTRLQHLPGGGLLAILALLAALPAGAANPRDRFEALPTKWQKWLKEEVYPIISTEQRKAFLELETEAQREEYVNRLWRMWGDQSGLGSAFRSLFEERLETVRTQFGNTTEDRARVLLIHGPPDAVRPVDCDQVFNPLIFWQYARIEGIGEKVTLIFYRPYGLGPYRLWDPFETRAVLYSTPGQIALQRPITSPFDRPEYRCGDAEELLGLIALAEFWMRDPKVKEAMEHFPTVAASRVESASARFLQFSTLLPPGARPLPFTVTPKAEGRRGGKVRMGLSITLPRGQLGTATVADVRVIQLDVVGEVSRESSMEDRFRYSFTLPAEVSEIPLLIERDLRPGQYRLRIKVQDVNSDLAGLQEAALSVVAVPMASAGRRATDEEMAAAEKAVDRALSLVGPEGEGVTGVQRFTALTGPDVARVEFFLDGHSILTKNRPPFEVELDLGPLPRLATVLAVAYSAGERELDRAQVVLNVGRERFFVHLQPFGPADRKDGEIRASVTLNVPTDRTLDRVDLYLNELRLASLYQPPYEAWLPFQHQKGSLGYLRAVAVLKDGEEAEDLQFIDAPQFLSGVEVNAVELPITVVDRHGKPVEGLTKDDFEVLEDGVPQQISHFALQRDLPVRLGLVIDTSASMEKTLPEVQRVVMGFLRELLRPRDRAFIVAFSDRPALLEGFTADFKALERAIIALRADRETAMYDAIVYGLFQFSGVRGRKAMVLLSDGKDNASRMDYERVLSYASRMGATIYTIGIDLSITELRTRSQLSRLADVTGGQAFFLPREAALGPIYQEIDRELRTQYLIAYTSSSSAPADTFREVRVRVKRPGLEARTLAGYYPGP